MKHLALIVACTALILSLGAWLSVSRSVDDRLRDHGLIEPASEELAPSAREGTAESSPAEAVDPVVESALFLAALDTLMSGYEPIANPTTELPVATNDTDILRCVTDLEAKGEPSLQRVRRTLDRSRQASDRERDRAVQTRQREAKRIREIVLPANHALDLGWRGRHALKITYGCWSRSDRNWNPYGNSWVNCCADDGSECHREWGSQNWRIKDVEDDPERFRYSYAADPTPPELLTRLERAGVEIPERFYCLVTNVSADVPTVWKHQTADREAHRRVACASPSTSAPSLLLTGPGTTLHIGDVVSVPLREVELDPNGVLRRDEDGWVLEAADGTAVLEAPATCPSNEEILAAVK